MGIYKATILWNRDRTAFIDNKYSRAHRWIFDGCEVVASSSPLIVPIPMSLEAAIDPEEAFVASLSSCHMLWFLSLAAKRNWVVESYRDEAIGEMSPDACGKLAITRVTLNPEVVFFDGQSQSGAEVIEMHHAAHGQCFIARSVKSEVLCVPKNLPN